MNYWIVIDRQKYGPLTLEEARRLPMTADSFVWRTGLPTWVKAAELPELADLFAPSPAEEPISINDETDITAMPDEPDSDESNSTMAGPEPSEPEPRRPEPYRPEPYRPEARRPEPYMGAPLPPPPAAPADSIPPKPPTYLVWSILSVILCCMIPGIVAIIYSAKVTSRYEEGDYEGSQKASETAELWLIIAVVCGLVAVPFQFLFMLMR